MDKAFIRERQDMLEAYFRALLMSRQARRNPLVRAILQLEPSLRTKNLRSANGDVNMEVPMASVGR